MRHNFVGLKAYLRKEAEGEPEDLSTDFRLFNEQIGLPLRPDTRVPGPMLQYQLDIMRYQGTDLIVLKSNKIGITEVILRDMVYRGTIGDCRGYQFLMTSSAEGLASENMRRLQRIFNNSPILRTYIHGEPTATRMELTTGAEYIVVATTQAAGRSWERVKYVFPDEAAQIGMLDDSDFFAALSARRANTNGYMRMVSTPHGQRGTFYEEYMKAFRGQTNAKIMTLAYTVGMGVFFTEEFIENQRKTLHPAKFAQEYECDFRGGPNAAIEPDLLKDREVYSPDKW